MNGCRPPCQPDARPLCFGHPKAGSATARGGLDDFIDRVVPELQFDYYRPFGFGAVVARLDEPMFDLNKKVTAQMLREREIAIHGSKQYVIDTIMKMRKECGYGDFCFLGWFELDGFEPKEIEQQMQIFAEEVLPVLASECGGKVELPARGLDLVA